MSTIRGDVESQPGSSSVIEMHPARGAPPVSAYMMYPPQHGDFRLPEHPTDDPGQSVPPSKDKLERIVGPNVGDFTGACADDDNVVMTDTLTQWIDDAAKNTSLTSLPLYVNLHRNRTHLGKLAIPCAVPISTDMQSRLDLAAPTHTVTVLCDSAAPQARIVLYLQAARHVRGSLLRSPAPTQTTHGWELASTVIQSGYNIAVTLPLVLDDAWDPSYRQLVISIEALDEDGLDLPQRNSITTCWNITGENDAYGICTVAQYACVDKLRLQMHELFGLAPLLQEQMGPQHLANGDIDTSAHEHSQEPLVINPTLMANATMIAEADREDGPECPICMSNPATTVLFPCTHALCLECAVHLRDSVQKSRMQDRRHGREPRRQYVCHICRSDIDSMLALSKEQTVPVA